MFHENKQPVCLLIKYEYENLCLAKSNNVNKNKKKCYEYVTRTQRKNPLNWKNKTQTKQ